MKSNNGTEAILHSFNIICAYLHKTEVPQIDFLSMNKKLYNYYNSKRRQEIKEVYARMKKMPPMGFKLTEKEIDEINKLIFLINKRDILIPLLIPIKEMDYLNELTENDMILFYHQQYFRKTKTKRNEQLIAYIFRGDNWKQHLYPSLSKTNLFKGLALKKVIAFIQKNYYQIKAGFLLTNYEHYLNIKN